MELKRRRSGDNVTLLTAHSHHSPLQRCSRALAYSPTPACVPHTPLSSPSPSSLVAMSGNKGSSWDHSPQPHQQPRQPLAPPPPPPSYNPAFSDATYDPAAPPPPYAPYDPNPNPNYGPPQAPIISYPLPASPIAYTSPLPPPSNPSYPPPHSQPYAAQPYHPPSSHPPPPTFQSWPPPPGGYPPPPPPPPGPAAAPPPRRREGRASHARAAAQAGDLQRRVRMQRVWAGQDGRGLPLCSL